MRLSSITVIVVRLFALYWFTAALFGSVSLIGVLSYATTLNSEENDWNWQGWILALSPILTPLAYLVFGLIAWFAAERIAKKVVRGVDSKFEVGPINPANLYSFGILIVGLYFFLTYLGGTFGWLHYLAVNQAGENLIQGEDDLSIYDVISQIVPCIGGLYFALLSERFGARLAPKQQQSEQNENQEPPSSQ